MKIPFRNLRRPTPRHNQIRAALQRVQESGRYLMGPEVEAFEAEFAAYLGVKHCVAVASGMAALRLGLQALGIRPGKVVAVPSRTFVGTWLAISQTGADILPYEGKRVPFASAGLPVHLYGIPAPYEITGMPTIHDCAQAHGAAYGQIKIGTCALVSAFSFYPTKPLGCLGDGGAVTTDSELAAREIRSLRDYGRNEAGEVVLIGDNTRMDELQAAVLRVELEYLDADNARRREIAAVYAAVAQEAGLATEPVPEGADPAWHQFVVYHEDRDGFAERLRLAGVETMVHYRTPPHRHPLYAGQFDCPNADQWAATVLSLPIYAWMPDRQVDYVARMVRGVA